MTSLPVSDSERAQLTSFLSSDGGDAGQPAVNTEAPQVVPQNESPVLNVESSKPSLSEKTRRLLPAVNALQKSHDTSPKRKRGMRPSYPLACNFGLVRSTRKSADYRLCTLSSKLLT